MWQLDIAQDKTYKIVVSSTVKAYAEWECGDPPHKECEERFTLKAGTLHDVFRIKYGKDFMTVKVKNYGVCGWVTYGIIVNVVKHTKT
ncbi:MAG: hypothetical protein ACI9Y1_001811 [Lentisphaeria bacterium]